VRQCPRCRHWHRAPDTTVCETCWEAIGQMQFWQDEDDDYEPVIDTFFDREEEARGYQ
jgi:hypothetical protein